MKSFYHDAHDILLRMEAIPNRLRAVKSNEQTILKIGCNHVTRSKMPYQSITFISYEKISRVSPRI